MVVGGDALALSTGGNNHMGSITPMLLRPCLQHARAELHTATCPFTRHMSCYKFLLRTPMLSHELSRSHYTFSPSTTPTLYVHYNSS
jgi:hypothetical protein